MAIDNTSLILERMHQRHLILSRLYGALLGIADSEIAITPERFEERVRAALAKFHAQVVDLETPKAEAA